MLGSAAAVAGVGVGVAAAKLPETDSDTSTVEGSFTVVDRRGRQRFLLDTKKAPIILGDRTIPAEARGGPDGSYFIFNDENGTEKGGIVATSTGALVSLDYPTGDAIHLQTEWGGRLNGAALIMNHMGDLQQPIEQAKNPTGVQLFTDTGQGACLTLNDPQGRPRIMLQVAMDGTPSIKMLDEQGAVVKQL